MGCEKHVEFYQLWYLTEKDGDKVYHINSIGYKGGALKRRDEVNVGCFWKKDDDTYIHVYKNVNHKKFPELENSDRLNVMKGGYVYRRNLDKDGLSWYVSGLRTCNRFTRPLKQVKYMMVNEAKNSFKNNYQLMVEW